LKLKTHVKIISLICYNLLELIIKKGKRIFKKNLENDESNYSSIKSATRLAPATAFGTTTGIAPRRIA
jgi:hypothetical protein